MNTKGLRGLMAEAKSKSWLGRRQGKRLAKAKAMDEHTTTDGRFVAMVETKWL